MPKKYSDTQKENIRRDLRSMAERSLFHKGVKDTSVDELVKAVGIPKGTFYLFYGSKEELYQDVMVSFRIQMQDEMLAMLQELDENHIVTSLTTVFSHLVENIYARGIFKLLDRRTARLVSRSSEVDVMEREQKALLSFFRELFGYFAIEDEDDIARFHEAFQAIVYSMDKAHDMERPLDAYRLLLRGLMLQLVGE